MKSKRGCAQAALVVATLIFTFAIALEGQSIVDKKSTVTVVIPASMLAEVGYKSGWNVNSPILGVELVRGADGRSMPKGVPEWRANGFPMLLQAKFEKVENKDGLTIVEYRSLNTPGNFSGSAVPGVVVKFRFNPGVPPLEMVRPFVLAGPAEGAEVKAYLSETYQLIAKRVFTGALADVAEPERISLVKLAHMTAKGIGLAADVYKDNTYLAVDLQDDGNVYNTLKLNEGQRLSKVVNERLLTLVKAFAVPLRTAQSIYGVKLHTLIHHKDFLKDLAPAASDDVSIYAPADLIRKFADADITSQEFIDGCVVIVNGNRVKVGLVG